MKFSFWVSMPSAIQPTLTPAPVMPSERAVGAFGLDEAVPVSESASGSSCTLPLGRQAPGGSLYACALEPRLTWPVLVAGTAPPVRSCWDGPLMSLLGMTLAT